MIPDPTWRGYRRSASMRSYLRPVTRRWFAPVVILESRSWTRQNVIVEFGIVFGCAKHGIRELHDVDMGSAIQSDCPCGCTTSESQYQDVARLRVKSGPTCPRSR